MIVNVKRTTDAQSGRLGENSKKKKKKKKKKRREKSMGTRVIATVRMRKMYADGAASQREK